MYRAGASRSLEQVLEDYHVDVLAIQEVRWGTTELVELNEYVIINSGHAENKLGTGFMIKQSLKHSLLTYKCINERLCMIRLKGRFFNISIISVHAPTEEKGEEEKDSFYDTLSRMYDNLPRYDVKIILGDFNAKIGKESAYMPTIGRYSKHEISNDNGIRAIDLAIEKGMIISSTKFPHKEIHKVTWNSPDGLTKNQIDHVLIEARHASDVADVRSYRGADADSDHYLVIMHYKQKIAARHKGTMEKMALFDTDKLEDPETVREFQEKVRMTLTNSMEQGRKSIEDGWNMIKGALTTAAEDVLGRKGKRTKTGWYDNECERALKERNDARQRMLQRDTRANREMYRKKRIAAKTLCRRKKRIWERKKLERIEEDFSNRESRKFYKGIRDARKGFQANAVMCKDKDGNLIADKKQILDRWRCYFREVLNIDRAGVSESISENMIGTPGEGTEDVELPDKEEIIEIIANLKSFKAPGIDRINAEMLKNAGEELIEEVYAIIWKIWLEEEMPDEWANAAICPVFKKGDRSECSNYRGIALLGTVYKVLTILLSRRLALWSENILGEYQSGFRSDRSTTDHIFSLRLTLEKAYEYDIDLYHLFIDFKQAYDSVDRNKLLKALLKLGIPKKLVRLINMTLSNSKCKVKLGSMLSENFSVGSGLRQGDPLSPMLFNLVLETAIRAIRTNPNGTILNRLTQHLAYADDVVITARSKAALAGSFQEFETASRELGLKINVNKTVLMKTSRSSVTRENMDLDGYSFSAVSQFKYLGAIVTEKNEMDEEVKARIAAGSRCFFSLGKAMRSKAMSRNAKLLIYRTIIRPVVTYGCETWVLTTKNERLLNVWERKMLRKIFGPVKIGNEWKIRKNNELRDLYGEPDLVCFVKTARLRWLGHVERMADTRIPKKLLNGKPDGKRRRARPRLRWLDDVEADLRHLGVRRWRFRALDREEWNAVLMEARVLNGP